jgi:hypothetical protein
LQEMRAVIDTDVAGFNSILRDKNIANIIAKTP